MTLGNASPRTARRSQQERRDGTQRKLVEATLSCLVELGHARTTTTEIVRAAGVSQGALFKHYPNKAELLAAAVAHLFEQLVAGYEAEIAALLGSHGRAQPARPRDRASAEAAFELLWTNFTSPRLAVAFELYIVARTDAALASCLAPVVRHHQQTLIEHARALFPAAARLHADFDAWLDLLMCSMEGMVIEGYGSGIKAPPALAVLKRLVLETLTSGTEAAAHARRPTTPSGGRTRS